LAKKIQLPTAPEGMFCVMRTGEDPAQGVRLVKLGAPLFQVLDPVRET